MIALVHHSAGLVAPKPTAAEMRKVMPPGDIETRWVRGPEALPNDASGWRAAILDQARQARDLKEELRDSTEVHYFGLTWIPLAVDLGARLSSFTNGIPYLRHHEHKDWRWVGESGNRTLVDGLPGREVQDHGTVVVRASASYDVTATQTREVVPDPLAEIDLRCAAVREDPFGTRDELEDFVGKWRRAINDIKRYYPRVGRIDLFLAGPVGLAFRMGAVLNPRIHPPVYAWQLENRYTHAVRVGRSLEELEMKTKVLFVSASPGNQPSLRSDIEVRDALVGRLLREAEHRDRFDLTSRPAMLAEDFQATLGRERPQVVHFSGHGTETGELVFERVRGLSQDVVFEHIVDAFRLSARRQRYKLVVINACHSARLAKLLVEAGVDCAIGMERAIGDDAAVAFSKELYRALGDGVDVCTAFDMARLNVHFSEVHDKRGGDPQLYSAEGVDCCRTYLHD